MNTTSIIKLTAGGLSNVQALAHSSSLYDKVYYAWLTSHFSTERLAVINQCDPNRGDMGESAFTGTATNRTGKQVTSHGDAYLMQFSKEIRDYLAHYNDDPLPVEFKTLSPKTKASTQGKGTTAKAYILICITKKGVKFRLLKPSALVAHNETIRLEDNIDKGIEISFEDVIVTAID